MMVSQRRASVKTCAIAIHTPARPQRVHGELHRLNCERDPGNTPILSPRPSARQGSYESRANLGYVAADTNLPESVPGRTRETVARGASRCLETRAPVVVEDRRSHPDDIGRAFEAWRKLIGADGAKVSFRILGSQIHFAYGDVAA
jgi:hypothetical protein